MQRQIKIWYRFHKGILNGSYLNIDTCSFKDFYVYGGKKTVQKNLSDRSEEIGNDFVRVYVSK